VKVFAGVLFLLGPGPDDEDDRRSEVVGGLLEREEAEGGARRPRMTAEEATREEARDMQSSSVPRCPRGGARRFASCRNSGALVVSLRASWSSGLTPG